MTTFDAFVQQYAEREEKAEIDHLVQVCALEAEVSALTEKLEFALRRAERAEEAETSLIAWSVAADETLRRVTRELRDVVAYCPPDMPDSYLLRRYEACVENVRNLLT